MMMMMMNKPIMVTFLALVLPSLIFIIMILIDDVRCDHMANVNIQRSNMSMVVLTDDHHSTQQQKSLERSRPPPLSSSSSIDVQKNLPLSSSLSEIESFSSSSSDNHWFPSSLSNDNNRSENEREEKVFTVDQTSSDQLIFPLVLCVGLLFGLSISIMSDYHRSKIKPEPEEQINLILCMAENAVYEYNLIFRVGCPTHGFDMKHSYIDFEILGPGDAIIGTPVRFDCKLLPDPICGEMHCLIGRITPMPRIEGVRANHSGKADTWIFFYEFELIDLKTDELIERRMIMDTIGSKPRVFGTNQNHSIGITPQIPITEYSNVEIAIHVVWTILLCAFFCIVFERNNIYFTGQNQNGSLYRSLQDLLFVSPIVLALLLVNIFVYKYNIKRIAYHHQYTIEGRSEQNYLAYSNKIYLFIMLKTCMIFSIIILISVSYIDFTMAAYWFSSTVLTSVTVLGIWSCLYRSNVMHSLYSDNDDSGRIDCRTDSRRFTTKRYVSDWNTEHRTMYFSKLKSFEPELVNPRRGLAGFKERKRFKSLKNKKRKSTATGTAV